MRCFIAVPVPEELKEKVIEVQDKIEQSGADLKLVEKKNLHFTVKFLGEISDKQIEEVKQFLDDLGESSFEISIKGLGVFPSEDYIKTIWLGVEKNREKLLELVGKINQDLDEVRKEKRKPEAHLTLARVKSAKKKEKLKRLIKELKGIEIGQMKVDSLKLMVSELTPEGPKYRVLAKFNLK